nr:MAG TPA: hypothetical protein [Caudoviricetes sp.]
MKFILRTKTHLQPIKSPLAPLYERGGYLDKVG